MPHEVFDKYMIFQWNYNNHFKINYSFRLEIKCIIGEIIICMVILKNLECFWKHLLAQKSFETNSRNDQIIV